MDEPTKSDAKADSFTLRKYLFRLPSTKIAMTFAVLVQADIPLDSAETIFVPGGNARPCQLQRKSTVHLKPTSDYGFIDVEITLDVFQLSGGHFFASHGTRQGYRTA